MSNKPPHILELLPKRYTLWGLLCLSLGFAIFVIIWSRAPEYRPLVQDMRLVNAVKIVDVLDVEEIPYKADIKNHILYVDVLHSDQARLALAKVGFVFDYPNKDTFSSIPQACALLESQEAKENRPIHQTEWFFRLVRMTIAALVLITLILVVVRPILKNLILEDNNKD